MSNVFNRKTPVPGDTRRWFLRSFPTPEFMHEAEFRRCPAPMAFSDQAEQHSREKSPQGFAGTHVRRNVGFCRGFRILCDDLAHAEAGQTDGGRREIHMSFHRTVILAPHDGASRLDQCGCTGPRLDGCKGRVQPDDAAANQEIRKATLGVLPSLGECDGATHADYQHTAIQTGLRIAEIPIGIGVDGQQVDCIAEKAGLNRCIEL